MLANPDQTVFEELDVVLSGTVLSVEGRYGLQATISADQVWKREGDIGAVVEINTGVDSCAVRLEVEADVLVFARRTDETVLLSSMCLIFEPSPENVRNLNVWAHER